MSDFDTNYMSGVAAIVAPALCHILRFLTVNFQPKTTKWKIAAAEVVSADRQEATWLNCGCSRKAFNANFKLLLIFN